MSLDTTTTSCKRKYLSCDYNDCDQIVNDPIILTCCGQTICSIHLEDLKPRSRNAYKCVLCSGNFSNPIKNLKLQQLLNDGISDEYNQAKSTLDNFKKILNQFETENDISIISEHFSDLRNKIDIKKELIIQNIEKYYSDLISQVNNQEQQYISCYRQDREKKDELGSALDKVKEWGKDLNDLFHDTDYWTEMTNQITKEQKEIKKKIENYKYKLLGNKVPMFKEPLSVKQESSILGYLYDSETPQYSFDQDQDSHSLVGLSSGNEEVVMVGDNGARKSILQLPAMYSSIAKMCLLSDKKILLEITDRALHLFDVKSNSCERSFYHSNSETALTYLGRLSDEEFLCVYSDKCVKKYRINSNIAISIMKLEEKLHNSIFELNNNNQLLILPKSAPRNSYIINTNQNLELFREQKVEKYFEHVSNIPESPNYIVVSGNNKIAQINLHLQLTYLFKEKEPINDIKMFSNNELAILISNPNESQINLWDIITSNCIRTIKLNCQIISLYSSYNLKNKLLCCLSTKALMLNLEKSEVIQEIDNLNGKLSVVIV